jgi:PAS domain S-box-containing protein
MNGRKSRETPSLEPTPQPLTSLSEQRPKDPSSPSAVEISWQQAELFRLVQEQLPGILWSTDTNLTITTSLGAGLTALGLAPNQLVGTRLSDYLHTEDPAFLPFGAHLRALQGESTNYDTEWMNRIYRVHIEPLRSGSGAVAGCLGVALDLTDQLQEGEERYRELFEANPQPMWVYDAESLAFLAVNDAAVTHYGYSREEFLGMTILDIRPGEDLTALAQYLARPPLSLEKSGIWRHRKKDGKLIDVEVTTHALRFRGRPTRLVLVHDVTDRKRLEERYRQAQKMEAVGQLAGGIAHDFNNLLTVINGCADLLLGSLRAGDPASQLVTEVRFAGERAAALTRQLLAFSRKQVLEPTLLNLSAVVDQMEQMLGRLIGEDITLTTSMDGWGDQGPPL